MGKRKRKEKLDGWMMKSTAYYSSKCQRGGERKEQETLIMNLYSTETIQMRMYITQTTLKLVSTTLSFHANFKTVLKILD